VKLGDITKESMATYSKHIQTDATWGCNMMLFQWGCDEEFEVWLRELSIFICSLKRQREGMRAFQFGQRNIQTHPNMLVEPPLFFLPWCIPTYPLTYLYVCSWNDSLSGDGVAKLDDFSITYHSFPE